MLQVIHGYPPSGASPSIPPSPAHRLSSPVAADGVLHFRPSPIRRMPSMKFLDLNNDVLALILSFVRPPDAIQLALTCHDAYSVAMPRFLSDVVLGGEDSSLSGPDQMTLFCKYMLADVRGRLRHLRILDVQEGAFVSISEKDGLEIWKDDYSCALIFADMLSQAVSLRKLHIRDLESLLQTQPAVADAFTKLEYLRDLSFSYVGKETLAMLKRTICRPFRLEFGLWKDGSARVKGDTESFDHYASSLKQLNLWKCACLLESLSDQYVSPGVRVLGLGGRVPLLSTISREFPNVRTITFAPECSIEEEAPKPVWSSLDYVDTSSPLPYFSCAVRHLELRYVLGAALVRFSRAQVIARTVELLRQTSPVVLSCVIEATLAGDVLDRMVSVIPRLRFLELVTSADESHARDNSDDIMSWMNEHVPRFGKIPLVGLSLYGSTSLGHGGGSTFDANTVLAIARRAAMHVPSLKYIGVGLTSRNDNFQDTRGDAVWFRVKMRIDGREPILDMLSNGKGESVECELRALDRVTP
ncbi:uncharacterized protein FIBRA_08616 [Fibroporia radiculosa]|uniref:F-box domain-containing protein n=1 Tax=Fibroporia radiculosa TaxID=599839 RepID=J4H597_9APHY|nr:uncharacterized protein FIBRA_08616 [Fibroporia radiculosa]CCM06359.1 predicted protein [Fibroporia radiculosa]